jgi:DNA-binding XRE family transcriptional regulator
MSILGERIRTRRNQLGLTQDELAKKMGYKSRSSINKIEIGENDIPQSKIVKFSKVLDTTPSYLMGWTDNPKEFVLKDLTTNLPMEIEILKEARKQLGLEYSDIVRILKHLVSEEDIIMFERGHEPFEPDIRELYSNAIGIDMNPWQLPIIEKAWIEKKKHILCPVDPSLPQYIDNEEAFIKDLTTELIIENKVKNEEEEFMVAFYELMDQVDMVDRERVLSQMMDYMQYLKLQAMNRKNSQ